MSSHPWFHPTNVYATHRSALELMVEILEAAVNDSLPEGRRRHPLPGAIPGPLLSPLVRDTAREIALSKVFEGQTLRATPGLNMSLHLLTRDNLLRIRTRKLPDPEQPVPDEDQLELEFPDDYADNSLLGQVPDLALFWAVKGEALYRVVLAAPAGWDDEASLCTWYGAVEVHAPAVRTLLWPVPGMPTTSAKRPVSQPDDLADLIHPLDKQDTEEEAPGDAS
jgi:hypothetical protein